ncbi:MAG: glycoside hydrolase domain-containing protein [Phycisphaerae bacterium]
MRTLGLAARGRLVQVLLGGLAFLAAIMVAPPAMAGDELVLCDFEAADGMKVVEGRAKVELVTDHATRGKKSGKVAPGFVLVAGTWTSLPADWSGYDELRLDVFNPGKAGSVAVWISDGKSDYYERHNNSLNLREGANTLTIPVGGLWRGEKGSGKFLDTKKIMQLVMTFPKEGADAYYLDNFRLVKGAGKVQTQLLLGFEEGQKAAAKWSLEDWPENKPGKSVATAVAEHATEGKTALKVEYRPDGGALAVENVPQDWSGFDTLEIDCFSTAEAPIKISGWVRDEESKDGDYWKRHNYQMNVRPGQSTIQFAVGGLYRGEKGSGKFLDTKKMVSFCIGAKGVTLFLDNIRLVKGTEEVAVEGIRKFDFGPAGSPNFPGFTPVQPDTSYAKDRGFGWVGGGTRDPRNYEQPDSLCCDFIRVDNGVKFAVDVAPGKYTVHIMLDTPGFWEYMPFGHRAIEANGKEVFKQDVTNAEFLKDWFFRYQDIEDLPGTDIWQRYVGDRFKARTFDVDAPDGKVELKFLGDTWGLTPSFMVLYPTSQAEAGKKWMEQLDARRKGMFNNAYAEVVRKADAKPTASPEEEKAGFILFSRGLDREVTYNSAPGADTSDTREPKFDAASCAGEYESFSFSIFPLKACGDLALSISDLAGPDGKKIPASAFRQRAIRYKFTRIGGRITSSYQYQPWLLVDFKAWPITAGVTRQFWLTLHVPADAAPGKYAGKIAVSLNGRTRDIPVALEVHPFKLDEPKMSIGMYGGSHPSGGGYWPADLQKEFRLDERTEEVYRDQREHGMTAVTPPAAAFKGFKDGKAVFDYTEIDKAMALLRKLGFDHECFTYAAMFRVREGDVEKACQAEYGMPLEQAIKLAYEELGRHAKEKNWLPMAWALADEPLIHGISAETVIKVFQAHRKAAPQMQFVTEDAMGDPAHYVVIPACDIVSGNSPRYKVAEAVRKNKSRYWFNNIGTDRLTFGWFLWKANKEMGVEALFQWGYSTNHADIYYDLDGFEGDSGCSFTASEGQRPRSEWEMIRQGANDHRYLQTLANLCAKAQKGSDANAKAKADEALKFCDGVMARIDLESKRSKVYTQADLEGFKRKLAGYIIELRALVK